MSFSWVDFLRDRRANGRSKLYGGRPSEASWYGDKAAQPAAREGRNVGDAISNKADWRSGVERRAPAIDIVKMRTALDEQHGIGGGPYALVEHGRFRARRDEGDAVAVFGHSSQPLHGLPSERRVAPDPTVPRLLEAVIVHRIVHGSSGPWPAYGAAGVKIKFTEGGNNLRWREPFICAHGWGLVARHTHARGLFRVRPSGPPVLRCIMFPRYGRVGAG